MEGHLVKVFVLAQAAIISGSTLSDCLDGSGLVS
jgi:hypothetical protein